MNEDILRQIITSFNPILLPISVFSILVYFAIKVIQAKHTGYKQEIIANIYSYGLLTKIFILASLVIAVFDFFIIGRSVTEVISNIPSKLKVLVFVAFFVYFAVKSEFNKPILKLQEGTKLPIKKSTKILDIIFGGFYFMFISMIIGYSLVGDIAKSEIISTRVIGEYLTFAFLALMMLLILVINPLIYFIKVENNGLRIRNIFTKEILVIWQDMQYLKPCSAAGVKLIYTSPNNKKTRSFRISGSTLHFISLLHRLKEKGVSFNK